MRKLAVHIEARDLDGTYEVRQADAKFLQKQVLGSRKLKSAAHPEIAFLDRFMKRRR